MDKLLLQKLLSAQLKSGRQAEITVEGVSMEPSLREGDRVALRAQEEYAAGDILAFAYGEEGLLIHRLVKRSGGRYYCKGDNAFRLEEAAAEQIAGKAVSLNGGPLPPCPPGLAELSYRVSRAFLRCGFDAERTKETDIYRQYKNVLERKGESSMKYVKNAKMDFIQTDETSLAVYDPESGDTHFFDETGTDILGFLAEPRGLQELLEKLCGVYDARPEDIRSDVEEFLQEAVSKGVVVEV